MLTVFGKRNDRAGFCDGYSRRDFLTIGGAAAGGSAVAVSHPDNPFVQWMSNTFGPYTDQILIAVAVITVLVALYVLYRTFFSSPETAH